MEADYRGGLRRVFALGQHFYRFMSLGSLLLAGALLTGAGCGKPAAPPPGAPQSATAPNIDQGTESGSQEAAASSTNSTSEAGTPKGDQGESK